MSVKVHGGAGSGGGGGQWCEKATPPLAVTFLPQGGGGEGEGGGGLGEDDCCVGNGEIRSPARIEMWLFQERGINFTYCVVTGLLKRCHTWVSPMLVLPVNVKDPASFVTGTHDPDRYASTS